jgi:3-deoxy-manno-octulosonate cytidylyltransferase (CMP-KDO synthetase)
LTRPPEPVTNDRACSFFNSSKRKTPLEAAPVIAVIPARYASTRLPAKALADIGGVPMVVRVWRQACEARSIARVIVATDDERIAAAVRAAGGEAMMTSPTHQSGTDRIAEVARAAAAEVYLNVQGDLAFFAPQDLDNLAAAMAADPALDMATLATPITGAEEWRNPNVVKVVCGASGDALYFSRSPIPFGRDLEGVAPGALRHIGVYAYRRAFLMRFAAMEAGRLEKIEKLEQLRALENGYRIRVVASVRPPVEVDTAADLERARRLKWVGG